HRKIRLCPHSRIVLATPRRLNRHYILRMCRHIPLLPMCLFDVSFLYCFELNFLIYSAMRGGAVVLFQYHFQCLYSSCLTFFYSCKEPEYAMFRFGSIKG